MFNIGDAIKTMGNAPPMKIKKLGRRSVILNKIAELTSMTDILDKQYWKFAGRFNYLKGDEGTEVLERMYSMATDEDAKEGGKWQAIKFWQLLNESTACHLLAKILLKLRNDKQS